MDAMAAARAAAEAAMYETASQEMAAGYPYHHHHDHVAENAYAAEQQERGYLESLQQQQQQQQQHHHHHPNHLGVQANNLLQDFLGASPSTSTTTCKDPSSTNELLHLLAQQQQQQQLPVNSMEAFEADDSMNLRPDEHYMTIAQDGKLRFMFARATKTRACWTFVLAVLGCSLKRAFFLECDDYRHYHDQRFHFGSHRYSYGIPGQFSSHDFHV